MKGFFGGILGGLVTILLLMALLGQTRVSRDGAVPSGGILLVNGACPGAYTELVAAQGRFVVGMPAGGTIGGTLGTAIADLANASYTPAGTNGTVAFTPAGTMPGHSHPYTVFTFTNCTNTNCSAGAGTNIIGVGTSLQANTDNRAGAFTGTGLHSNATVAAADTFTGTAGTIPAQAFTGTPNATMRSVISPYIQLRLCSAP